MERGQHRSSDMMRVVVADDHPLYLDAIIHTLSTAGDIVVVGRAGTAAEALELTRQQLPDLVLLDVTMPGSGLTAARDIKIACPATKIVILTASEEEDKLLQALKAGASGYLLKGLSARELVSVVRSINAGEVYVAPALASRVLAEMTKGRVSSPLDELTEREREVLELLVQGLSNGEIGQHLNLAEKTIKHYMTNILAKLQVRSRVEAALLAQKAGLGDA
ncbi:MAG: response regulator transcription factor [Herpetosiphonaceae bacterium]|nr:response regulator transcription factor [Herpetosiphonaceae bacterium]